MQNNTIKYNEDRPLLIINGRESMFELIGGTAQLLREIGEGHKCVDMTKKVLLLAKTFTDTVEVLSEYIQIKYEMQWFEEISRK